MFSLTLREQILIVAVLVSIAGGSVVHHLRTRQAPVKLVQDPASSQKAENSFE